MSMTREDLVIVQQDETDSPLTSEHAGDGTDVLADEAMRLLRSMANDLGVLAHVAVNQNEQPEEYTYVTLASQPWEMPLHRRGRKFLAIFAPVAISNCFINIFGMPYTFMLPAGWSVLNFPDGTLISGPPAAAEGTTQTTTQVIVKITNDFQGSVI